MGVDKKQRILIVEDDHPLASGLCRALQNEKTETVSCHTLQEAEKLLDGGESASAKLNQGAVGEIARTAFDLVVLDVNLPDGNGFDFL
jgi:DNA-binding response OmpR family regulator